MSLYGNTDVLVNIAANAAPIERLLTGGAYLLGIFFAVKAMFSLKHIGEMGKSAQQSSSMKEPVLYFIVSAGLLYFPTILSVLMNTSFGYSSILQYSAISSPNQALSSFPSSEAGYAVARIFQVIGLAAFIRGWLLIAKAGSGGQQQGNTAKGFTHIFGGVLAMNIMGTLQILSNTLYGTS